MPQDGSALAGCVMRASKILWLIYKRLRTATGVSLGFTVMYGAYTNNLNLSLSPIAIGAWLILLAGDLYNDSQDYEEDKRNKRIDKWTTQGLMNTEQIKMLAKITGALGLFALLFTTPYIFLLGLAGVITGIAYSHPRINLKKKELAGYIIVSLPIFFIPFAYNTQFHREISEMDIFFSLFAGFHYLYLYCQKDATDRSDDINLFKKHSWRNATLITALFAFLSLIFFIPLTFFSVYLIAVWFVLAAADFVNLYLIATKSIKWATRKSLVLVKFLVPYMYLGAV